MVLFRLVDGRLPENWAICVTEQSEAYRDLATYYKIVTIVGYKRIVENINHYTGILERDHQELLKFYEEKKIMDAMYREESEWLS